MRLRTVVLCVVLAAIALFVAVNWTAFMIPTTLSLVVTAVQAPLGLILLGIMVLLTALFLAYLAYMHTSVLMESRQHARALERQRELADRAEASRFTELRAFLDGELKALKQQTTDSQSMVIGHLDRSNEETRTQVEQATNTLSAYIGELEDRLGAGSSGSIRS